jgi:rfaE bifunctional protein nucleotidyltransferase chain/domain
MFMDKIVSCAEIGQLCGQYRRAGKTIVFTNGCFDILHAGHVTYLDRAARFGDVLVLGLNSDVSVRMIKGEKRPVTGQAHRATVVAALECVDHVVIFDEPDPAGLIENVCPHVLVKGADWAEDEIIGGDFVKAGGGCIKRVRLEPDISTTKIIERIGRLYYGNP